jgi:hypothetical protein
MQGKAGIHKGMLTKALLNVGMGKLLSASNQSHVIQMSIPVRAGYL